MCHTDYLNKEDFKDLAIAKIKLAPKDKDKLKLWSDNLKDLTDKKTKLYLLVDAHTGNPDLEIDYYGRNPKADGSADTDTIKNYWLDMDGKWFEVKNGSCKETWDKTSNTRIKKLHSHIQCATKNFINNVEKELKIKLRVVSGYRSFSEQTTLYINLAVK